MFFSPKNEFKKVFKKRKEKIRTCSTSLQVHCQALCMPDAREILSYLCTCTLSCSSLSLRSIIIKLHMVVGRTLYYNPSWKKKMYNLYRCCQKQIKITTFSVQGSVRLRVIIHSSHYFEKRITSFFLPTTTLPFIAVVTTGIIQNLIQNFKCNKMWQYFLWSVTIMQK